MSEDSYQNTPSDILPECTMLMNTGRAAFTCTVYAVYIHVRMQQLSDLCSNYMYITYVHVCGSQDSHKSRTYGLEPRAVSQGMGSLYLSSCVQGQHAHSVITDTCVTDHIYVCGCC